ncbi:hypothetical protein GCM10009840_17570 [Pseudolysinimonas kribbensis]|uniref:hypothetical protein n=1 Tax=Pseudolysinimonas kribbensis TaxID=433641 RepID=UPI0031D92317
MPEPDPGDLEPITLHPRVVQALDRVLALQRPVVLAHIRSIRARRPAASPAELITSLERRYLAAVTGGGAAVGATAAIPAVGTAASLAISGAETLGFLEASALFAQSVTEVHGIAITDPERARTLVMAMMLGTGGQDLVRQLAGQAAGGENRTRFWGELVGKQLPRVAVDRIGEKIRHAFLRRFAVTQGGTLVGRALPFGIGAVVGGTGNHLLGRKVVQSARSAFGPAPATFPEELAVILRASRPRRVGVPDALRRLPKRLPLPSRAADHPPRDRHSA